MAFLETMRMRYWSFGRHHKSSLTPALEDLVDEEMPHPRTARTGSDRAEMIELVLEVVLRLSLVLPAAF